MPSDDVTPAGDNVLLWPLPVSSCLGDGLSFPSAVQQSVSHYQSLGQSLSTSYRVTMWYWAGPGGGAGYRPVHTSFTPESPNRTLVNPVLGKADTVVNISQDGGLTELKVERWGQSQNLRVLLLYRGWNLQIILDLHFLLSLILHSTLNTSTRNFRKG